MDGLDCFGVDDATAHDTVYKPSSWSWANMPTWKKSLIIVGGAAAAILGVSTLNEIGVSRDQLKKYGEYPVGGRHWDRTWMTGLFDWAGIMRDSYTKRLPRSKRSQ